MEAYQEKSGTLKTIHALHRMPATICCEFDV